jgi:hypothetical protein
MPVFDLFSKRKAAQSGNTKDVYQYDTAPEKLRVQVVHILNLAIGTEKEFYDRYSSRDTKGAYQAIVEILRKEYGVFKLTSQGQSQRRSEDEREELLNYIMSCTVDHFLDVIELSGRLIENHCSRWYENEKICEDAILELNVRLREASFGYQFEAGSIIRVDTEFAHQQITKPAIAILNAKHLKGAREEFLNAHEHYRERRFKECISECLKAFESTMKSIGKKRKWQLAENATAKVLVDACFENGLIPDYMKAEFSALRAILEAGVPTTRNRTSGHGQGIVPISVPDHLAAFVLHQTAASLIFLDKSDAAMP